MFDKFVSLFPRTFHLPNLAFHGSQLLLHRNVLFLHPMRLPLDLVKRFDGSADTNGSQGENKPFPIAHGQHVNGISCRKAV